MALIEQRSALTARRLLEGVVQDAILAGYRGLAEGRVFESSGGFKADMATLDRKEADGWKKCPHRRRVPSHLDDLNLTMLQ